MPCQQTTGVPQWTWGQRRVTTSAALRAGDTGTGDMACRQTGEDWAVNTHCTDSLNVSTLGIKPQKIKLAQ